MTRGGGRHDATKRRLGGATGDARRCACCGKRGGTAGRSTRCPPTAARAPSKKPTRSRMRLRRARGLPSPDYKIGATNARVQARFGVNAPFSGRLFADFVGESPLFVPPGRVNFHTIEPEFDFVMGRALTPSRCALDARRGAGGRRERPSRDRGAGLALHGLALDDRGGPDRRQRDRGPALSSGRRGRAGSTAISPPSRSPCASTGRR